MNQDLLQRFPDDILLHDRMARNYVAGGYQNKARFHFVESLKLQRKQKLDEGKTGLIFIAGMHRGGTGFTYRSLRDGLGIIENAAETSDIAEGIPDTGGVYFVPAFAGLGAPHWDPYARGTIVGITGGTGRAHIVRATLEAIAYHVRDVLEVVRQSAPSETPLLRADGGGSDNRFLMQFQADMLGIPVEVPEIAETTALGAAHLAGLAVGFWDSEKDLASKWQANARYEPRMSRDEADKLYNGWERAVERARDWERKGP